MTCQGDGEAYEYFNGICDGLPCSEEPMVSESLYSDMLPKNFLTCPRLRKKSRIQVIVGNPPYSAGQGSATDNAQNQGYPMCSSQKTEHTYAAKSRASP